MKNASEPPSRGPLIAAFVALACVLAASPVVQEWLFVLSDGSLGSKSHNTDPNDPDGKVSGYRTALAKLSGYGLTEYKVELEKGRLTVTGTTSLSPESHEFDLLFPHVVRDTSWWLGETTWPVRIEITGPEGKAVMFGERISGMGGVSIYKLHSDGSRSP